MKPACSKCSSDMGAVLMPVQNPDKMSTASAVPAASKRSLTVMAGCKSLIGRQELFHAADCAAATSANDQAQSAVVEFPLVAVAFRSSVSGLWRSLVAHLTGGQGVASSNLASPTKPIHSIRPSRTCIQPTFLPPSITPSDGRSGPATDHQAENAVPASSMACTSGCR